MYVNQFKEQPTENISNVPTTASPESVSHIHDSLKFVLVQSGF